ncbi:MAG: long-chain fatty acid--CoA ligase [Deltaproteobacteria bacterium]|nr:MAG: long-chain fatty acid--CoA ligase [Deltaproteobacteria bacterium]
MANKASKNNILRLNISDWIKKWAIILPKKIALIYDGRPISYRNFNERINRLSNTLLNLGVKKGDRVAALLANCVEFYEIFFACAKIEAIFVPLNFRLAGPEITYILNDCSAETLFFGDPFGERIASIREETAVKTGRYIAVSNRDFPWAMDYEALITKASPREPHLPGREAESPHMIMYTSGTTGFPKGAVFTHRKTFFNILNANIYYHVTPSDKIVVSRPLFHSGGLLVDSLPFLYNGGTVILKRRFEPEELVQTIQHYGATVMETSATMYRFILERLDIQARDLPSVKLFYTGGEVVPLPLLRAYGERGIIITQLFGQTETSTITWLPAEYGLKKMGSVGLPVFHGEVKIVDKDGNEVPPNQVGEVIVSGPILMSGYWGHPDLTAQTIRDGWLYTGDVGRKDEEGFFYILDRRKNMFISGGENVYPAEVEKVLYENDGVKEVAIIGVPDEKWGEVGKAFVVLREGANLSADQLTAWCAERVAKYKVPKYFEFVDSLPKNAAGKVMKHHLKSGERSS